MVLGYQEEAMIVRKHCYDSFKLQNADVMFSEVTQSEHEKVYVFHNTDTKVQNRWCSSFSHRYGTIQSAKAYWTRQNYALAGQNGILGTKSDIFSIFFCGLYSTQDLVAVANPLAWGFQHSTQFTCYLMPMTIALTISSTFFGVVVRARFLTEVVTFYSTREP